MRCGRTHKFERLVLALEGTRLGQAVGCLLVTRSGRAGVFPTSVA